MTLEQLREHERSQQAILKQLDKQFPLKGPVAYPLNSVQKRVQAQGASPEVVRTFATGANRDTDESKIDYEGFLSPLVLERFGQYMHKNRRLRDGSLRDSDNWQKGMPLSVYMKSLWRHFFGTWSAHRRGDLDLHEEDLCGILFNTQGMLHEVLKAKRKVTQQREGEGV